MASALGEDWPEGDLTPRVRFTMGLTLGQDLPWFQPEVLPRGGGYVELRRYDLEACLSITRGLGLARLQATREAVRNLLAMWATWDLPRRGGLVVHAVSLVRHERAYLLPAGSGVGKTTLAARVGASLSDEFSLVTPAEGRGHLVFPSPFWGDGRAPEPGAPRNHRGYPLAGLYFLEQAPTPFVRPIPPGDALTRLMARVVSYSRATEDLGRILDACSRLCRDVPAHRLGLDLHTDPWTIIPS